MNVMVIAPHTDDEVLGPGGTVARHAHQGDRITVLIVADRATDHEYRRDIIDDLRSRARSAADLLGVHEVAFLGLPDERLGEPHLVELIAALETEIVRVRPERLYLPHRGDNNQDHRAVFEAAMVAARPWSAVFVKTVLCYETPSSTDQSPPCPEYAFQPNLFVDIRETLELKLKALSQCYDSELRPFPHPRSLEGVKVYASRRGMQIGSPAAEAFLVIRHVE